MSAKIETIAALDEAIKRFGTYQLHDKGAAEVMDVDTIARRLSLAGIDETVETLNHLHAHPDGEPLIHYLIMVFVEDELWPELADALITNPVLGPRFVPWLA